MPTKKTDLKMEAGVKLTLVEEVTPTGTVRSQHYRLATLHPNQPASSPSVRPPRTRSA